MISPPADLVAMLRHRGLIDDHAQFETLYGGRTNQVWKVLATGTEAVLKLYCSDLRNPLFRNDAKLEADCLRALKTSGFVPNLRATGACGEDHWVFYDHAPGTPWQHGVECVAHLLHDLHTRSVDIDAPTGCNGSDDLREHTLEILAGCRSDQRDMVTRFEPNTRVDPLMQTSLIHGDPVAGNILVASSGLTLIDWQCPAYGDPCEDLAMFLSPAMQYLYRGAPLAPADAQRFLTAYGGQTVARFTALRPWFAWRMAAYCLWRLENGASDYATGLDLELAILQTDQRSASASKA